MGNQTDHFHRAQQLLTLETVSAGDHWDRRISRQMAPLELMLG